MGCAWGRNTLHIWAKTSCWDSFVGALQTANDSRYGVKPESLLPQPYPRCVSQATEVWAAVRGCNCFGGEKKAHIHTHTHTQNKNQKKKKKHQKRSAFSV